MPCASTSASTPIRRSWGRTQEPHARGAILVAAIFDAFLTIYNARKAPLVRLATNGSGVLGEGALHPDLVEHLAHAASKSAEHVLTICIRALDYLPPVDVTFGDYLRALITADYDMVPDDPKRYRVAFVEAFRRHGIYPTGVRSLSEESLLWKEGTHHITGESAQFTFVDELKGIIDWWGFDTNRGHLYKHMKNMCGQAHEIFKDTWGYKENFLKGLSYVPGRDKFEVHAIRPVRRVGPDGRVLVDLLVEVTQRRKGFLDGTEEGVDGSREADYWFRGGCTILVDMNTYKVRYCIYKDIKSQERWLAQLDHERRSRGMATDRSIFLGAVDRKAKGKFFSCLHRHTETGGESWQDN